MYAIVDIETTGGKFNEEGITEIAIYKFDGHEIVDKFISLVNPEKPIQPFVVQLTGITNKMLTNAPKFYEIAKRIVEITEGCILVAHNTSFDYRILRTEFRRLGYDFVSENLCTVQLSRKLLPEQEKYKLSTLTKSLGIPLSQAHRAAGDALATVALFKLLLQKDTTKEITTSLIKTGIVKKTKAFFVDILETIPSEMGIFYIYDDKGKIVLINKSKNMKRTVNKILTSESRKAKQIQNTVCKITFELTGNELLATLKEKLEIEKNRPFFNGRKKKKQFKFGLYKKKNEAGYFSLNYQKVDLRKKAITCFINEEEAVTFLREFTKKHELCEEVNKLTLDNCSAYVRNECKGACKEEETTKIYNTRVDNAIKEYIEESGNLIILDSGRETQEKGVVLIEDETLKGFGYTKLHHQIENIDILRANLNPIENTLENKHLIESYLRRKRVRKIINLKKE